MVIAACGNDCASCPRYNSNGYEKTDEQLHNTAILWQKIGYRDHVANNDEISCSGCKTENWCRYGIVKCVFDKGLSNCGQCVDYPCERMRECLRITMSFEPKCREVCTDEQYRTISKAFFEKDRNLNNTLAN